MKNLIFSVFATLFAFLPQSSTAQSTGDLDHFTVQVDGLGCPFCAYGLEKKFKELKGIKHVAIDMETGVMNFDYPADRALTAAQVETQVDKAGYTPVSYRIERADGSVEESAEATASATTDGSTQTYNFFVAGNCGMCKARIERAASKVAGVQSAVWDQETKQLTVTATSAQDDVAAAVARAGHDTKTAKADKGTYDDLPGCCHYERVR